MHNQKLAPPKVCVLTQTASDLPPYYRQFFAELDVFFVTFKQKNPEAVDFLPGSTWSAGRNRLWEHVKGKYDYYLFLDDDLEFLCLPSDLPPSIRRILQAKVPMQEKLRVRRLVAPLVRWFSYQKADSARFRKLLFKSLAAYRPLLASFARTQESDQASLLDQYALHRGRRVRPLGWFDAQATLFSNVAAELLLPYDTHISGWWSSQIPIYCLGHLAFKDRAMSLLDIASQNERHLVYRPGYDGVQDCLTMSEWLSHGIQDPNCDPLNLADGSFIDFAFAGGFAKTKVRLAEAGDETLESSLLALKDSFDLHHPYIYDRHREMVDALDSRSATKPRENVHE